MSRVILRAVLRNALGEHLFTLKPEEIDTYELLAEQGQIRRFLKLKKGQPMLIFRLKSEVEKPVEPSDSKDSECELTDSDSFGLAGMTFPEGRVAPGLVERWMGHGLIAPVFRGCYQKSA